MKLCHARDRTELIHAVKTIEDSPIIMTHCGCQIRKVLPHVAIDCWGNDDMQWCPGCTPAVDAELRRNAPPPKVVRQYDTPQLTPEYCRKVMDYRMGHSRVETEDEFNISRDRLVRIVRRSGMNFRYTLSMDEKRRIAEHSMGRPLTETAAVFDVAVSTVFNCRVACGYKPNGHKAGVTN